MRQKYVSIPQLGSPGNQRSFNAFISKSKTCIFYNATYLFQKKMRKNHSNTLSNIYIIVMYILFFEYNKIQPPKTKKKKKGHFEVTTLPTPSSSLCTSLGSRLRSKMGRNVMVGSLIFPGRLAGPIFADEWSDMGPLQMAL